MELKLGEVGSYLASAMAIKRAWEPVVGNTKVKSMASRRLRLVVLPKSMALCLRGLRVHVLESGQACDGIEQVQNAVLFGTWCRCDRRHPVTRTLHLSAGLLNRSTNGPQPRAGSDARRVEAAHECEG